METFEQPSRPLVDERQAAFARLVARIIDSLNDAVDHRAYQGISRRDIANKIGIDRSSLSRVLNGASPNLTLRSISDIFWACQFEPKDFQAEPIESIQTQKLVKHMSPTASTDHTSVVHIFQQSNVKPHLTSTHFTVFGVDTL